jgi:hypothetical protein
MVCCCYRCCRCCCCLNPNYSVAAAAVAGSRTTTLMLLLLKAACRVGRSQSGCGQGPLGVSKTPQGTTHNFRLEGHTLAMAGWWVARKWSQQWNPHPPPPAAVASLRVWFAVAVAAARQHIVTLMLLLLFRTNSQPRGQNPLGAPEDPTGRSTRLQAGKACVSHDMLVGGRCTVAPNTPAVAAATSLACCAMLLL